MIHGEAWFMVNAAMCACALPLGGKLAGLAAPAGKRLLAAAALGGVCALLALPALPEAAMLAAEPARSTALLLGMPAGVWLCFGRHGSQACLRCLMMTLSAALLTGGAATALMTAGAAPMAALGAAVALSMMTYLLATLLPAAIREVRQVELCVGENSVLLPAMLDSGNLLRDPVTALPVLVAPMRALRALFPDMAEICDLTALPEGFRLLSIRTAAGSGLLPMFRPDRCRLYLNGRRCEAELLVAVAGREYRGVQALVPLAALPPNAAA